MPHPGIPPPRSGIPAQLPPAGTFNNITPLNVAPGTFQGPSASDQALASAKGYAGILIPFLPNGIDLPTPPGGPATTPPPDGACGCPHITPLASSDKPDPGHAEFEFSANDLDWEFSNRLARFNGDWQKALNDLARAIDPDGSLRIAQAPTVAAAVANAVPLVEGDFTRFLINGPPDAQSLPPAPHPLPGEDARVGMQKFLYGPARVSGLVINLLTTIARSDKYGEPAFGVRDAAVHWLRFLAEDLGRMPNARARSSPTAARVALVRAQVMLTLQGVIEQALRPDPRWRETPRFARIHSMLRDPRSSPITDAPAGGLTIDIYDLASATLDVFLSVRRDKQVAGLTEFMGRPTQFNAAGIPVSDRDGPPEGISDFLTIRALVELAALHSRFGGPAPKGSPAEAVSCKTLSVLMGFADRKLAHSAAWRRRLWAYMVGDAGRNPGMPPVAVQQRRFHAMRAAALLAGLLDGQEAQLFAPPLLVYAEEWFLISLTDANAHAADFRKSAVSTLQSIRDITRYATGPGRTSFSKLVDEHVARVQATHDAAQAARDRYWNEMVPTIPLWGLRFPDANAVPPVMYEGQRPTLLAATEEYLGLWQQAEPDMSAAEWQALCPPAEAPPRVLIFTLGPHGPILLDKLYQNIPLMLGVTFAEAYEGDSWPVAVQASGGRIDLVARRTKENAQLYLTEPFVIGRK
jgi:hypothetical protein